MPSARIRFAAEAAFLVLVALGLGLARFDPIVIGFVIFTASVLVALLERASAKEARRARKREELEPPAMPPPRRTRRAPAGSRCERGAEARARTGARGDGQRTKCARHSGERFSAAPARGAESAAEVQARVRGGFSATAATTTAGAGARPAGRGAA